VSEEVREKEPFANGNLAIRRVRDEHGKLALLFTLASAEKACALQSAPMRPEMVAVLAESLYRWAATAAAAESMEARPS
jgi:hypothetical protein